MENKNSYRNQLDSLPEHLTPEVVSQRLHISQATLKKWIKNGELRGVKILKIGAVTRFESSSFKDFMEKRYS